MICSLFNLWMFIDPIPECVVHYSGHILWDNFAERCSDSSDFSSVSLLEGCCKSLPMLTA